jgi:hypothetical protein
VVWILLALLGVPLWLVAGALIAGLLSRRSFCRTPGAFKVALRLHDGEVRGLDTSWPRLPGYGHWVHDVLIVHRGLGLVRTTPYPVASCAPPHDATAPAPSHLGRAPVVVQLTLDDGAILEMAAPHDSIAALTATH